MGNGSDRRHDRRQPLTGRRMFRRWTGPEWRHEPAPAYDLRQYVGGRPTGMVAAMSWRPATDDAWQTAHGPDGWLLREPRRLVLAERRDRGEAVVRMQIPLRACVDAAVVDEPGLPGRALVRFTVTARFGAGAPFSLTMWFSPEYRHLLTGIVRDVNGRGEPPRTRASGVRALPPLEVRQVPDDGDWVAFQPGPCSADVLRPGKGELR